uniref:Uncharacterized protein n=1 Tax=Knipowitschia caucasica TaxID=637954 RepID=A0AAV2J546_KNICA
MNDSGGYVRSHAGQEWTVRAEIRLPLLLLSTLQVLPPSSACPSLCPVRLLQFKLLQQKCHSSAVSDPKNTKQTLDARIVGATSRGPPSRLALSQCPGRGTHGSGVQWPSECVVIGPVLKTNELFTDPRGLLNMSCTNVELRQIVHHNTQDPSKDLWHTVPLLTHGCTITPSSFIYPFPPSTAALHLFGSALPSPSLQHNFLTHFLSPPWPPDQSLQDGIALGSGEGARTSNGGMKGSQLKEGERKRQIERG